MARPSIRWKLTAASLPANLVGALLAFSYFSFIDRLALSEAQGAASAVFFVVGFSLLMVVGSMWANRWTRRLSSVPSGPDAAGARLEARRRAILLPYVVAGISAVGWTLAGLIWGVLWPL